jgi:hypothetical protein
MRLMGRWNWWSPRFLQSIIPKLTTEGEPSPTPSPGMLVLTGLSLEYLARKIENANGGSPNLVRATASLASVPQDRTADGRARLVERGIVRPLALQTLLAGLRKNGTSRTDTQKPTGGRPSRAPFMTQWPSNSAKFCRAVQRASPTVDKARDLIG